MKRLLLLLLISPLARGFTLHQAEHYAHTHSESPSLQKLPYNPDYTSLYATSAPSYLERMLDKMHLKKLPWSFSAFTSLLKQQIAVREKRGYAYPHAAIMQSKPGSDIILIGPLFGSFHSLVRILKELQRQGLLSEDLTLNTTLVLLGNTINSNPYNLETLTLILALMQANPDKVIFLRGEQEQPITWQSFAMRTQLSYYTNETEINTLINHFFMTLPQELIVEIDQKRIRLGADIPISLTCLKQPFGTCPLTPSGPAMNVQVSIEGEKRSMSYAMHPGLILLPAEKGITSWSLFSAPNKWYRDYFNFYYDAFVILTLGSTLAQSALTLYNQDVREQRGFKQAGSYALLTGQPLILPLKTTHNPLLPTKEMQETIKQCKKKTALERAQEQAAAKEGEPIYLGCTLDLSKGVSAQGKSVKNGISLAVNYYNQQGGVQGRPLKVIFMDDGYSPEKARENVESFMRDYKSNLFLCNLGSPTLAAYLDLVKQGKIFLFFPITGAPMFRKPDLPTIVHWRASYATEAKELTNYIMNTYKSTSFGFLYQNDSYGIGALQGSQEFLRSKNLKPTLEVSYERSTTSFKQHIEKLKSITIDALGFYATAIATIEFIRQAGVELFIRKHLFGLSDLAEESFKKFAQQKGLEFIIAQFAPNPTTSNLPLVKEFRQVLNSQGYTTQDVFALEGYIATSLVFDILKKTKEPFTPQSVLSTLTGIKDYSYKGLTLSYDPQTRELAHLLWIDTGAPEWIRQEVGS